MIDRLYRHYRAYILRLYRVPGSSTWRAMLYSGQTNERLHFRDLTDLFAFLEDHDRAPTDTNESSTEAPDP